MSPKAPKFLLFLIPILKRLSQNSPPVVRGNIMCGKKRKGLSPLFYSPNAHKPFHLPHSAPGAFPQLLTYSVCHSQIYPGLENPL